MQLSSIIQSVYIKIDHTCRSASTRFLHYDFNLNLAALLRLAAIMKLEEQAILAGWTCADP